LAYENPLYSTSDLRQIRYTALPTYELVILQLIYGLVAAAPGSLACPSRGAHPPSLSILNRKNCAKVLRLETLLWIPISRESRPVGYRGDRGTCPQPLYSNWVGHTLRQKKIKKMKRRKRKIKESRKSSLLFQSDR